MHARGSYYLRGTNALELLGFGRITLGAIRVAFQRELRRKRCTSDGGEQSANARKLR